MQPSADTTAANHQLRSTDPRADKITVSYSHSPSNNGTLQSTVPKRPSGDGEYHQRSHSAAMGPMGVNENHGPVRGKPGQSPSRNMEGSHDERAVNGNHDSLHVRGSNGMEMGEDDEHDEDDDMDGQERDLGNETDEENVDELMDEADFEDGEEGSESMDGNEKGGQSSWDSHDKDLPRQGGPRNNRPLQVRPTASTEAGGLSSAEYSESGSSHINGEGPNGPDSVSLAGPTNSVNNGSSKKRTTPAKHKCPQCDKYFTRPFNLKSHQRTHTQERPFVCSFSHCARAFSRLHDCNRHMRTHWRIKPYSCPECHRNFVRQDALTRHLRLDFGHNRCTGFPGPSPGTASNQEKTEDNGDGAKSEPSSEGSSHPHSAPAKLDGGSATSKAGPSYKSSTSPTSPTHPSVAGHGHAAPRSEPLERDGERPVGPMSSTRDPRVAQKPHPATDLAQPKAEPVEEREQLSRREPGVHARYPGVSVAPMSFVHRSTPADRRAITPPDMKENSAFPQHTRSFSHSSFSQSQPSGPVNGPSPTHPSGPERRSTTTALRNGAPWGAQGHDPASSEYYHGPHTRAPPPGHIVTRQESYGEYDRPRPPASAHSEYPPSPHEARRSPPPHSEWSGHGPERSWSWDNRSAQDSRHRPSWSVSGRGSVPHPQEQGHHPSPIRSSTMDSWRGPHAREGREDTGREAREGPGPIRIPPRSASGYPSSPYSAEPGPEGHSRTPSGAYRRPGWSERRPPHEMDMGMDIRRYEHHPNSPQDARDYPSVHRLSVIDGPPLSPELPHGYSERGYPYNHERENSRDLLRDGVAPGSASSAKDPAGRPARSTTMDYEPDRDYHRPQRYSGESKRETRGSMSPVPPHRHPTMEGGRPYEGNPNYPYPSDRPEQYTREEMERMAASRTFRNEDRMVMSPLPREDQGGYFGEPGRPSSYRPSQGYSAPPQRAPESPHHYPDAPHEPARRERHSMDVPMTPTPTVVGPPAASKRTLTAATVATR